MFVRLPSNENEAFEFDSGKALKAYYIAFFLYIISAAISHSTLIELSWYGFVESFFQMAILALLAWKLLFQAFNKKRAIVVAMLSMFAFVVWQTSGEGLFFWAVLFIVAGRGVRFGLLAKVALAATLLSATAIVSMCVLGGTENIIIMRSDGGARYALGFTHPNYLALMALRVIVLLVVVQWGRPPIAASCFSVFAVPFVIFVTDSRTSAAVMILALLLIWAIYLLERFARGSAWKSVFRYGLLIIFAISFSCSLVMMIGFDPENPIMLALNSVLSGRPYYANLYYQEHAPALLGFAYENGPTFFTGHFEKNFLVDNAYCSMLLRWGLLATGLAFLSCVALMIKAIRERFWGASLFGLFIFSIYGLTETSSLAIDANIYLVALETLLYGVRLKTLDGKETLCSESGVAPIEVVLSFMGRKS